MHNLYMVLKGYFGKLHFLIIVSCGAWAEFVCVCADGSKYSQKVEQERERWEQEQQGGDHNHDPNREWSQEWERPRRISPRSISKERWVETMVVGDSKLVDYHGSGNVESYIFTIMNMASDSVWTKTFIV